MSAKDVLSGDDYEVLAQSLCVNAALAALKTVEPAARKAHAISVNILLQRLSAREQITETVRIAVAALVENGAIGPDDDAFAKSSRALRGDGNPFKQKMEQLVSDILNIS